MKVVVAWDDWMEMQYLIPVLIHLTSCFLAFQGPPRVQPLRILSLLSYDGFVRAHSAPPFL